MERVRVGLSLGSGLGEGTGFPLPSMDGHAHTLATRRLQHVLIWPRAGCSMS